MIVALAGGVGGAKLALGLQILLGEDLNVVVNTGDDFRHLGLAISPDLDTMTYTLAGLSDAERGWGLANETWNFMSALGQLGGPTWFQIGDRDLATHIERTRRLETGETISAVTDAFRRRHGVRSKIIPMSNEALSTVLETDLGVLAFQDYFVRQRCDPVVKSIRYEGVNDARASSDFLEALDSEQLQAVVVCPSNPFLSIDPILALSGVRARLSEMSVPIVAVSPLVAGRALKGPTAKLFAEIGIEPTAGAVARRYADFLDGFVLDSSDRSLAGEISALGLAPLCVDTIMTTISDKVSLAHAVLDFARGLHHSPAIRV